MVGLGWIDNILFAHASAHRDLCTYTHTFSLCLQCCVVLAKVKIIKESVRGK